MKKAFTVGQALGFGWQKTTTNFWLMVGVAAVVILVGAAPSFLLNKNLFWGTNAITWLLGMVVGIGLIKIVLKIYDSKPAAIVDFFSLTWEQFLDYLVASLLLFLITLGGFILLIVPGVIFSLKFQFAPFLVIDKKISPLAAIKKSGDMTKGYLWALFGLWLMSILIIIAGAVVFGVGLFVAVPVTVLAQVYAYRKLLK